jgi:hypothetical protein
LSGSIGVPTSLAKIDRGLIPKTYWAADAAARDNKRAEAAQHLETARTIAGQLGEDRDDYGTEFGPTNVAIHAVNIAVELGDAGQAIELGQQVTAASLSPERQARYWLDLAQAHNMRR